jgi:pimeloyl-ACP methyl ester carboxylesterase
LWVNDEQLKKITVPTLVVYGDQDQPSFYQAARARFPNLQFQVIPNAGHSAAMQSPEFVRDVRVFIEKYSERGQN